MNFVLPYRLRRIAHKVQCIGMAMLSAAIIETAIAMPRVYEEPGLHPNREYVNQDGNEFIDPFHGGLQRQYVDLHLPGNGKFDLKVIRSYSSHKGGLAYTPADRINGLGWSIHFGRIIKKEQYFNDAHFCSNVNAQSVLDNPYLELPDGGVQELAFPQQSGAPTMVSSLRWKAECASGGGESQFTLRMVCATTWLSTRTLESLR